MKIVLAALLLTFVTGVRIPDIDIIDDTGRVRSTAEWRGTPTIVAPMYCRCPLACPMIAQGLKRGVAASSASATSYRVVLFSFDPKDKPEDLRRFREKQKIPLAWTVATAARPGDARRLLDAAGYRYGEAGGHFTHPNAIIALTPDLETAKFLVGTSYDVDDALAAARGGRDWIGQYGGWMLGALLLVSVLSAIYLMSFGVRRP
jgi:protein SCO1/2